jgi:hypothetical protein
LLGRICMLIHSTQVQSTFTTIESPEFTIRFSTGSCFAELIFREGALFDENLARQTKLLLEESNPDKKYFLLVQSEGFFHVTKKARRTGADKTFSSHLAAVACFTNNATLFLLGELYNKINKPAVPTRVFHSREAAEEWLFTQMQLLQIV